MKLSLKVRAGKIVVSFEGSGAFNIKPESCVII